MHTNEQNGYNDNTKIKVYANRRIIYIIWIRVHHARTYRRRVTNAADFLILLRRNQKLKKKKKKIQPFKTAFQLMKSRPELNSKSNRIQFNNRECTTPRNKLTIVRTRRLHTFFSRVESGKKI